MFKVISRITGRRYLSTPVAHRPPVAADGTVVPGLIPLPPVKINFRKALKACGFAIITTAVAIHFTAEYDKKTLTDVADRELPLHYDEEAIELFWKQHAAVVWQRQAEILISFVPFVVKSFITWDILELLKPDRANANSDGSDSSDNCDQKCKYSAEEKQFRQREWSSSLRSMLIGLGPAFIKLGQIFSIRPDLLPAPMLFELQKLCDAVPAYPTAQAIALIEQELGAPVNTLFDGLDEHSEPIAAASLGQVYKCYLKHPQTTSISNLGSGSGSGSGSGARPFASAGSEITVPVPVPVPVAVKVQRPDMVRAVSLDIYIVRQYMRVIEATKSLLMKHGVLAERKQFDVKMLDAFARGSYFELDYQHEAQNQEYFRAAFAQRNLPFISVPYVYRQNTSRRVLTSEWVDGIPLAKSSPETIRKLVPVGVECFLLQLLELGLFHGDPHPGNLLVNKKGQLVLIDFGLCAEVAAPNMGAITTGLLHLMNSNVSALLEDAIVLGFLPVDVNKQTLLPVMRDVFNDGRQARVAAKTEATPAHAGPSSSIQSNAAAAAAVSGQGQYEQQSLWSSLTESIQPQPQPAQLTLQQKQQQQQQHIKYEASVRRQQFRAISGKLNSVFYDYPFVIPEYFALLTRALIVLEGIAITGDPEFDIFASSQPYASKQALKLLGRSIYGSSNSNGSNGSNIKSTV